MVISAMKLKTLAPWKKSSDKATQHIIKLTKVSIVKALVFLVVIYGCESWNIKKSKCKKLMLLSLGVGEDF